MATQCRPRHDDTGPFAGLTYKLIHGGPGPQNHDFHMRDRDVTLVVEGTSSTLCLLHLQNVRVDTVVTAQAAVDDFLDQLEPTAPKRPEQTVFQNFDKVRQGLRKYVATARVEVEDLYHELESAESYPKRAGNRAPEDFDQDLPETQYNNPVSVVRAACEVFLEQLKLVDDSDEVPKRHVSTMSEYRDEAHQKICDYMEAQAETRGLVFEWSHGSFPRDTVRKSGSRIIYDVYFNKDGNWDSHYGLGG